jgi:pimeloyl-ACP methyl ester carboxylesterase
MNQAIELSHNPGDAPARMRRGHVACLGPRGFSRMAYTEWGEATNPRVVVCVHGLTRNGRDFDALAQRLMGDYRVICPDVMGRGLSDFLADCREYAATLIARLGVDQVDWVGTSMGGLIGMLLAAQPGTPIRKLVLNDVGPVITAESLQRIGTYLGESPRFPGLAEVEAFIRYIAAPFGKLSDAQWRHITVHSVIATDDGGWKLRYDPGIGEAYRLNPVTEDVDLWSMYESLTCSVLAIRGADSDLMPAGALREMAQRGPKAQTIEFPGVGHAPMLMDDGQIGVVREFLLA